MSNLKQDEFVSLMMRHRSVRSFDPDHTIPTGEVISIIRAGQQASTSCSGQFYSIIEISKEKRDEIYPLCGSQQFVKDASFFCVICVDVYRLRRIVERSGGNNQDWGMASLMIGIFDAGLMAQNMALAAESKGYDICFCGSCGDKPEDMINALDLPEFVMPLTGLAIGKGTEDPPIRPRLPTEMIHHVDSYSKYDNEDIDEAIEKVGQKLSEEGYYQKYSGREPGFTWRDHMVAKFGGKWLNTIEIKRREMLKDQQFL